MSSVDDVESLIVNAGATLPLVALLRSASANVQRRAVAALGNLATHGTCASRMLAHAVLLTIV